MKQREHSIDHEMLPLCPVSAQDVSMDVEAGAKFGYHLLEVAKYFTLDLSEE